MKFGYAFWGFLADRKYKNGEIISTPDGNASYSWSILKEAQDRGWTTYLMQEDRDLWFANDVQKEAFSSFSTKSRYWTWAHTENTTPYTVFPELDVLLIEWRFPIPGRNCDIAKDHPDYQPDYDRQFELLGHYGKPGSKTKIILWDLDQKLPLIEEFIWRHHAIFETSVNPNFNRDLEYCMEKIRVEPPVFIGELMQFATIECNPKKKLAYIGSRYERDDVIEEWMKPISEAFPGEVMFWGNWLNEPNLTECKLMWPDISYNRRVTMEDFREIYSDAVACPILAKPAYLESGFVTPRIWEALLFGTLPVGLSSHFGIEEYLLPELIAETPQEMIEIVDKLSKSSLDERDSLRKRSIEKIRFMDVKFFVDEIERVINE